MRRSVRRRGHRALALLQYSLQLISDSEAAACQQLQGKILLVGAAAKHRSSSVLVGNVPDQEFSRLSGASVRGAPYRPPPLVGISHPMDLVLFDPFQTKAVPMEDGKTLVEVATWFDNETSYISHFMKLAELL